MEEKLNIDHVIASLGSLDNYERAKLQNAIVNFQSDLDLRDSLRSNLDDIKNGREGVHQSKN